MYASRLAVIKGPDEGKEFTIPVRGGGIGRGQWNAIQLSDPEISRSHCVIEPHGSSLLLIDLGSRSGIKVNGQAVTKHTLSPGDLIILGRTYLSYIGPESIGASATSEQVSMPGAEVLAGRYELMSLLGVGGMGSVYRVRDRTLDEVIAVKVLRRDLAESNEAQRRFRHEVKLARRVTHRNVARIFDIGSHGGELFLTMELIEGESLSNMLARRLRLPPKVAIELCLELCAGLAAAHAAGVVHRDLKPDNVLIAVDGRVVITDFGIAFGPSIVGSAERERHVMGTPAYVAPEVVRGYPVVDARADIYSLGAVLFEMVTGWAPWAGNNAIEVATARLFAPPPDPRKHVIDLPAALVEVIMRCMAQDRDDRYVTIDGAAEELAALPEAAGPDAAPRVVLKEHSGNNPIPGVSDERALKRVAVLPFDTTGSTDEAYLAEGFTAELIDFLSMIPGLRVCAHGQVTPFGTRRDDLRGIGRELGVDIVVLGTIDRHDDGVHIDARVINVVDGFQLWAKRFDADPGALFSVNDEAARAIAQALTLSMHAPPVRGSVDPVAIDLYLRGRSQYRKVWAAPTERAVELFEQARAREPNDPSILAGCALARARLGFHQGGDDSAKTLAQQAVVLAPNHAEARLALATAHFQEFDFATALAEVGHAIAISPALAEAHLLLGRILIETDPVVAAVQCLEKAVFLDSHLYFGYRDLARAQLLLGYSLEAAKVCLDQLPMEPSARIIQLFERVRMAVWRHSREEAELLATELSDPSVPDALPIHMSRQMVALLLGQAGVPTDFAEQVGLERGGGRRRAFFWQIKAELHACAGEAEPCLDAIAQAVEAGMFDTVWLERCPLLELVTHSSRFAQLREIVRQRSQPIFRTWRRTWRRGVRSG